MDDGHAASSDEWSRPDVMCCEVVGLYGGYRGDRGGVTLVLVGHSVMSLEKEGGVYHVMASLSRVFVFLKRCFSGLFLLWKPAISHSSDDGTACGSFALL